MSDKIQVHLVFCEDFRMEVGSKPMLLGMLAPVFHTAGGVNDEILLVTLLTVPAGVKEVELRLSVEMLHPNEEPTVTKYKRVIARSEDIELSERWSTILPLPIEIDQWRDGTRIQADLRAGDSEAFASVTSYLDTDEDEQGPSSATKKVRSKKKGGPKEKSKDRRSGPRK